MVFINGIIPKLYIILFLFNPPNTHTCPRESSHEKREDNTTALWAVAWNPISASQYAQPGSFTVQGAVYWTSIPAIANIIVTVVPQTGGGFDYGSIDFFRMPAQVWKDAQWNDPGGSTIIDVTTQGLPADDPTIDAAVRIPEIIGTADDVKVTAMPATPMSLTARA